MAAQGILYRVFFDSISITNAAQDIIGIAPAAGVPVLIHSWKLTFVPTIVSGVAQDVRGQFRTLQRSTAGSGGTAVTPTPANTRNTLAAQGVYTRTITTVGTPGTVGAAEQVSTIVPYERVFTADQRILIPAGTTLWALNLEAGLGAAYNASLEMYVEEI
jgi:hypothetical protein